LKRDTLAINPDWPVGGKVVREFCLSCMLYPKELDENGSLNLNDCHDHTTIYIFIDNSKINEDSMQEQSCVSVQ